jgi:hypothetical protein
MTEAMRHLLSTLKKKNMTEAICFILIPIITGRLGGVGGVCGSVAVDL